MRQRGPVLFLLVLGVLSLSKMFSAQPQDGRCYLRRGRSSDSFSVSELLQPGEAIGTLDVGGDAGPNGNIVLTIVHVKPYSHLVDIVPETKSLVLKEKLDKEGVDGPSSLQVNVRCDKKDSNDPAIIIPARIVVQDANDNVPSFVNTPYVIQLSEAMTPGMLVTPNVVKAFDRDQPGPFSTVEYVVQPGIHSHYLAFQSSMSSTLVVKSPLDYETLPKFSVTVGIQDKGQPPLVNTTTLTVHVVDADDQNPRFLNRSYTAVVPETNSMGDVLNILPAPIEAEDQDRGLNVPIRYTFDAETADSKYFSINSKTGTMTLTSAVPQDMILPVTLVVRASQVDNEDRRALATLTVSRGNHLLNGLRFLSPLYHLNAPENLPVDSILLRLQTNRPYDQHLLFSLKDNFNGQFSVVNAGQLVLKRPLDYEAVEKLVLEIHVTSGRMTDVTRVELTVLNVNEHDPKFNAAVYSFEASAFSVNEGRPIGYVVAQDSDRHDKVMLTVTGTFASAFFLDNDGGLHLRNASLLNKTTVVHLVLVATDNGEPPRRSSASLEVVVATELLAISGGPFPLNTTHVVVIVFGIALGVFFFIIVVLAVHIAKKKHKRERVGLAPTTLYPTHRPLNKMAGYMTPSNGPSSYSTQQKLVRTTVASGNSPVSSDSDNNTIVERPLNGRRSRAAAAAPGGLANPVFDDQESLGARRRPNGGFYARHPPIDRHESGANSSTDDTASKCSDSEDNNLDNLRVVCNCHKKDMIGDNGDAEYDEEDDDDDVVVGRDSQENLDRTQPECDLHRHHRISSLSAAKRSSMKVRAGVTGPNHANVVGGVPRRVKKLSWEDEKVQKAMTSFSANPTTTTHDGDMAPDTVPYSSKLRPKALQHPDLTVYF